MHTKTNNTILKNGFNPVLGSIPRLPIKGVRTFNQDKSVILTHPSEHEQSQKHTQLFR